MKVKIFILLMIIAILIGGVWYYTTTSEKQFTNATLVRTVK
ncbi:hypothetical protein NDGK_00639 [Clostridiales bacterium CHKCI001]|nr:hypothetical protein NDGK_00639 [Clostridiales bacterium CHKCI001]